MYVIENETNIIFTTHTKPTELTPHHRIDQIHTALSRKFSFFFFFFYNVTIHESTVFAILLLPM